MRFLYRVFARYSPGLRTRVTGLFLSCLAFATTTYGQSVSGTVTDYSNGEPLPGVNILIKGTTTGTVTDMNGGFTLDAAGDNTVLVFSFIGYESREVVVGGRSTLKVSLMPDLTKLDELVVVGYGTVKKSDLTGSVSSVNVEETFKAPVARLDQALQGRAAGVQVTSVNGAPGAGTTIRVRGGNSITAGNEPLYVIDGFIGAGDLSTISPNDIKSIEVLKDASSTSIYGARGANGVVIITTKKGVPGKTKVNINTSHGFQALPGKVEVQNAREYARFINEGAVNNGGAPPWDLNNLPGADTDWQDVAFRKAYITNNNISIQGGTEKTKFYLAGNYFKQEGIMISSGFERYNFRLNLDHRVSGFLSVGTVLSYSHSKRNNAKFGFGSVVQLDPLAPVYNENGDFNILKSNGGIFANPVANAEMITDDRNGDRFLANAYANFKLSEGLSFKTSLGTDFVFTKANKYVPGSLPNRLEHGTGGTGSVNNSNASTLLNENLLNFNRKLGGSHVINAVAGFTLQSFKSEGSFVQGSNLSNDVTTYNALQFAEPEFRTINTGFNQWNIVSFLGRVNYTLLDKYMLTASIRRDGSSRLGKNNKWATFPSAAIAWKLSEEPFIKNLGIFHFLKVKASYGLTGNQGIPTFSTLAQLGRATAVIDNTLVNGVRQTALENPNVKWETTRQFDIGTEFSFFSGRLSFEFDYYYKKTTDLLFNVEVPFITGFDSRIENVGSLQNSGFEALADAVIVDAAGFRWQTTFNISTNNNEVLSLGEKEFINTYRLPSPSGDLTGKLTVGEPVGVFVGYIAEGIDPETGDLTFRDINGDGKVDDEYDEVIIGNSNPDFFGGIQNTLSYKNFELSFFFQGSYGNDLYNTRIFQSNTVLLNSYRALREKRWTPENPDNAGAPGANVLNNIYPSSTFHIQNGSYLRLKTLQVSYNIPTGNIRGLDGLRVYLTGANLWLLTDKDYLNYDPEVSQFGTSAINRGYDTFSYPRNRSYMIGMDITF